AYTFIATLAINNYTDGYKHGRAFRYSTSWNDGVLAWGSTSACKITTTTGQWRVGFWAKRSETTNPNTGYHVMCGIGRGTTVYALQADGSGNLRLGENTTIVK